MNEENVKKLFSLMFGNRDSSFFVIEGIKEIGKTSLLLWFMEQGYKLDYWKGFGINHELKNAPFEYDLITDLKTLKQKVRTFGKRYFFGFDELGKNAPKVEHWKPLIRELVQDLEVIRKYKLTLGGCSIGNVDSRIMSSDHLDFTIRKLSKTTAKLTHLRKRFQLIIKDIPNTTIDFDQYGIAQFTNKPINTKLEILDRDMKIALNWGNGVKYQGELAKSSFYEAVKRGIRKLEDIIQLESSTYKQEVIKGEVTEP